MARTRHRQSARTIRRQQARQRAKEAARRKPFYDSWPRPVRSRWFWTPVVAAVLATTGLAVWWTGRPVGVPAEPAAPERTPISSYRVMYRLTDTAGNEPIVNTEVLEVARPYRSRVETRIGPPPGTAIRSGTVTNREFQWSLLQEGEPHIGARRNPGGVSRDTSIDRLREAVDEGFAEELGSRTMMGLECIQFAFLEPRPDPLEPPTDAERVESCVTGDGVVLREAWTYRGRLVSVRQAVHVELDAQIDPDRFFVGREPDPDDEASQMHAETQRVLEDEQPETTPLQPRPPEGFELDRHAVYLESPGQAPPRQSYYESYRRGLEIVAIEQGMVHAESPPWRTDQGGELSLTMPGAARIVYHSSHVELRLWQQDPELDGVTHFRVQAPTRDLALWFLLTLE